ncbi:MAG: sodium-dependent transporter [Candidatus Latescibacterota bacterium]|nr:MAG: sodium-dependent transporter [Candidatus Latescibacterota bacterium]
MSQELFPRGQWKSRVGFILAASGSAIGLGNIVFFSANAYRFGGGAFYLPYLLALFVFGIPVMILEFGLGNFTGRAFPESLHRVAGRKGEFVGWWANLNAGFITMYYITILSWVIGMFFGAFGALWRESLPVPAFGMAEGELSNPYAYFFHMLSTWKPILFVAIVWIFNILIVRRGAETIESATKVFVPLMWIFMVILIIRGVTLDNGVQGVYLLFTPNFSVMKDPAVWQGAFAQTFFSLSLGFGIMTAYASYLPKKSDLTTNSVITSLLDSGFAYIAGLAVFSILFAFAIVPQASTLGMMFFIIPQGIGEMPQNSVTTFGVVFFALLLLAGLTSSVSLVEALVSSMRDKFGWSRKKTIAVASVIGFTGSAIFALPQVVNPGLEDNGTLGLTLLDLVDHWSFSYGLLIIGFCECILVGWVLGADKIRIHLNENSKIKLGLWFDILIKYIIPLALLLVLGYSVWGEVQNGIYGTAYGENYNEKFSFLRFAPRIVVVYWLVICSVVAFVLARRGSFAKAE